MTAVGRGRRHGPIARSDGAPCRACPHHRRRAAHIPPVSVGTVLRGPGRVARLSASPEPAAMASDLGEERHMSERRSGWVTFAGVLLMISGALNIVYGISAISNSKFFNQNAQYIFSNLKTWGWISLIIGIIEILAAGSLWRGGLF